SMAWFEHADRYLDRGAVQFAYAMAARHGPQMPWRYQRHLLTQIPAVRRRASGPEPSIQNPTDGSRLGRSA
uniref:hypothetical protein n=1 Tax=Nocardia asiatica TaxID=209252 RepID=UPI0024565EF1